MQNSSIDDLNKSYDFYDHFCFEVTSRVPSGHSTHSMKIKMHIPEVGVGGGFLNVRSAN